MGDAYTANMNNYMKPTGPDPSQGIQYYGASPIANPQSRIYNGYATNGSPGAHGMQQNVYADDMSAYGMDDGGDNGDPKRRRIARVCLLKSNLVLDLVLMPT